MRSRLAPLLLLAALAGCSSRQLVSPRFSLTLRELRGLAATLPADVSARVTAEPRRFLDLLADALTSPAGALLLVDKAHALDRSWTPPDLVDLSRESLSLSKTGLRLRSVVVEDLLAMSDAARANGAVLTVASAWRSWDTQAALRAKALETQPREQVDRELAAPGHSQHQLGTVIDLGSIDDSFADTAAGRWMAANAWRFGWSLSYPQGRENETGYRWESWHYRWIGRPAAELVHSFFGDSQHGFLEFYTAGEKGFRAKLRARD
jgi:D-alanyl-D-alanine carboxypeptidase